MNRRVLVEHHQDGNRRPLPSVRLIKGDWGVPMATIEGIGTEIYRVYFGPDGEDENITVTLANPGDERIVHEANEAVAAIRWVCDQIDEDLGRPLGAATRVARELGNYLADHRDSQLGQEGQAVMTDLRMILGGRAVPRREPDEPIPTYTNE